MKWKPKYDNLKTMITSSFKWHKKFLKINKFKYVWIIWFKLKKSLDEGIISKARKKLTDLNHRGPDNIGYWYDKIMEYF